MDTTILFHQSPAPLPTPLPVPPLFPNPEYFPGEDEEDDIVWENDEFNDWQDDVIN